jgi:hypothetical protein
MAAFDRDQLLAALNEIGAAAVAAGTRRISPCLVARR